MKMLYQRFHRYARLPFSTKRQASNSVLLSQASAMRQRMGFQQGARPDRAHEHCECITIHYQRPCRASFSSQTDKRAEPSSIRLFIYLIDKLSVYAGWCFSGTYRTRRSNTDFGINHIDITFEISTGIRRYMFRKQYNLQK